MRTPGFDGATSDLLGPQSQNVVVNTNGSGIATITYPRAYPAGTPVVVVMSAGNGEVLSVDPAVQPTATEVRVYARSIGGAVIANQGIRVHYIATPATA